MNTYNFKHFNMSSAQETLFSLELMVDYVRFDGSRANVLTPAVAVRFLDFPTLLIYQSGQEDLPSKPGYADLRVSHEALSQADDGDDLKYPFHKGKSCLFRINLHSLHTHLTNTPLYTMVLDVKDEIPKFIGSAVISLAQVTERIKQDVDKHGIGSPSAYGERLKSPICNLMGNNIGVISLAYKIVSLGAHLIPHIPQSRVYEVGVTRREETQPKCEEDESETHSVLSQHISIEGQPTDVVISEAKRPGVPAFTQTETEQVKRRVSWCEDLQETNTFCPPPFFYSSSGNEQPRESSTGLFAELENLNIEDPEVGNDEVGSSDVHEFPEADRSRKFTSTPRIQETDSTPLADIIRRLPLLSALLAELSQLNLQTQMTVHHPSTPETSASGAKPKTEERRISPKQRPGQSKVKGGGIKSVKSGKKSAEKMQPKRPLKYGLTNTFRLRLKLVKSDQTSKPRHECIEYLKQKSEMLSEYKHARQSVCRGLDNTAETLFMDPKPAESRAQSENEKQEDFPLPEKDRNLQGHIPSQSSEQSERHSSSSDSKSVKDQTEYQDDFTSLNTSTRNTPVPFSSPEPNTHTSQSKGLPVPAKADTSPQRSLKRTHVIRPRLQTSALSLSSDDNEHSQQNTASVMKTFGKSESLDDDSADEALMFSRESEDSANNLTLKSGSSAEHTNTEEEQDELGSLGHYHHISELVINKLPGYTL